MVELLADEGGADVGKATPEDAKALRVDWGYYYPPSQEEQNEPDGGVSPLYIAARNGRDLSVRALIERGANVNQVKVSGVYGATPLAAAATGGHADVVKLLLENGGDVNQANNEGVSPVFYASQEGHTAAIKVLLENDGDAKQAMNDGRTPVFIASLKGHTGRPALRPKQVSDDSHVCSAWQPPAWMPGSLGATAIVSARSMYLPSPCR
jgi:ankyrin repeat protein